MRGNGREKGGDEGDVLLRLFLNASLTYVFPSPPFFVLPISPIGTATDFFGSSA